MKTTKYFAAAVSAGILTFSLTSPSLVFAQNVTHPPKVHVARLQTNRFVLEENNTYSLQDVFNSSVLTIEEQERITQEILDFVESEGDSMDRSIMRTVIRRLSPSEVQDIVNSDDPISEAITHIPGFGFPYSILKSISDSDFRRAARNGWGMEWVIAVDRDNPTATGIDFYWNYVK